MSAWVFAATAGEERIRALLDPTSLEAISDRVAREMEVLCRHRQQCDDDSKFSRIVFCLRVSPSLFDLFFNSPNILTRRYSDVPQVARR